MSPSRHQTIANDLRRRIATGALGPGETLPSIRALCRRWKVAPGTVLHAIQVLKAEGMIRSVPRSGYRVVGTPSPSETENRLTRKRIVDAGIRMADRHGLGALSIRALAEELNTRPMSLYRHVESKDQLVWLMVDAALGDEPMPEVAGLDWRAGLELTARREWQVMQRHPWLSRALHISRPGAQPNALTFAERVMTILETTKLSAEEKLSLHIVLHSFVQGLSVNVEAEAQAARESGIDERTFMDAHANDFHPRTTALKFPHFARMLTELGEDFDPSLDRLFEEGLKALLDGFAQRPALRGSPWSK